MRQEEKVMNLEELKVVDADVAAAIEAEMDRQNSHIELIASENWVSDAVMEAQGRQINMQKDIRENVITADVSV